ncbi:hypothetical protein NW755_014608 [Fusarium falciforme]|uniref:Uncharacterized protein n=1 Tax=Fusarium falciforme TaxID=195108 RepID=A0A9W8UUL7_9HYPO|nr:hypothetical protein NW755_014608 [Fusarium falciforme]
MTQAPVAIAGTLTSCPDIWADLELEPRPRPRPSSPSNAPAAMVINGFPSFARALPSWTDVTGAVVAAATKALGQQGLKAAESEFAPVLQQVFATLGFNSNVFYTAIGVALPDPQPIQQVAAQARQVNEECPSLWYVNFPKSLSVQDAQKVRDYRQSMQDFRSWSSAKWWNEVNRRQGIPDDFTKRVLQSKEFAKIACEDMVKMSWLRTTKNPLEAKHMIDCTAAELHENIVSRALTGWSDVDQDTMDAVEPILQDIVRTAQPGTQRMSEMKVVLIEKYVFDAPSDSITSYIRLVSFELQEAFYDVIFGKAQGQARVSLQLSLLQYEAAFEQQKWEWYSKNYINDNDIGIFEDLIKTQSIDVK